MMKSKRVKRKVLSAFTLVELLIVVLIIGFLASAMMLILNSGNDGADAARIISDLRSLKAGAILYYLENSQASDPKIDPDLIAHMDRQPKGKYGINNFTTDHLYAFCDLTDVSSGVIKRLKNSDTAVEVISSDTIARIRVR